MSTPLIQRLKRKLAEELESTGESHPMNNSKRPKVDNEMSAPRILPFTSETIVRIVWELVKAKCYKSPYDSQKLEWTDNLLWEMIIENLKLPLKVAVEDFKMTVLEYYQLYQKDVTVSELDLPETFLGQNTVEMVHQAFKKRREGVGEYLISSFYPSTTLAIQLYQGQGSASTGVSHGSGSADMFLSHQSDRSQLSKFAESLQLIKGALKEEEVLWAEYEMTKYKGQMSLFCARSPAERVNYVKEGYAKQKAESIELVQETQPLP